LISEGVTESSPLVQKALRKVNDYMAMLGLDVFDHGELTYHATLFAKPGITERSEIDGR